MTEPAKKRGRPKKIDKEYYTDGKIHDVENIPEPIQLSTNARHYDDIIGKQDLAPYPMSSEDYASQLREKDRVELQKECISHGIFPSGRTDAMVADLLKGQKNYLHGIQIAQTKPVQIAHPTGEVKKWLETAKNKLR